MTNHDPQQHEPDDRAGRFMDLFSKNEHRVKSYIVALLPNWADAEDVFAETNIRLWKQFDAYDSDKDFGAWACTIAHYQVFSHRKQLRRERKILSDAFLDTISESMPGVLEQSDYIFRSLRHCLEKLADRHRSLLRDVYDGSRSIAEIAESLDQTPLALSAKLYRLRRKLHGCIEAQLRTEDRS